MRAKCIICGSLNSKVIFEEFQVDILRCKDCKHVFSSYLADPHYDGYFGEKITSEDQFWWDEAHRKMYEDFCRRFIVGRAGKLLDVGCGLGYFVKKVSSYPGWQAIGYEISKAAVEFATTRLNLRHVFCGKVEESDFPGKHFDIISLWDVIEHIPDPHSLLAYLLSILKDAGFLFIHTPNVWVQLPKAWLKTFGRGMKPGTHYLEAKDHINIYSPRTMRRVLRRSGFRRVEFVHLRPIQGVAGSKNEWLILMKNAWFYSSVVVHWLSMGGFNMDNLFVVARK